MLEIRVQNLGTQIFDPRRQEQSEYEGLLKYFVGMVKPEHVVSVTASGDHLSDILASFSGIPKPGDEFVGNKFVWFGVYAETLVANILNSLYNDDSFIIKQVKDVSNYGNRHNRSSQY